MLSRWLLLITVGLSSAFGACETARNDSSSVSYAANIEGLLNARCVRCHAGFAPAGKWRADSYLGAIGCVASGEPAATASGSGAAAPILTALDRPDHAGLVSPAERAMLAEWVTTGSARSRGSLHGAGFADPRSPLSHGRLLRLRHYAPMLDASDREACGACHDGVASRREGIQYPAPNAPSCTSCHAAPGGPLACSTCHGSGARESAGLASASQQGLPYPPRDRCFFPTDPDDHAHAAHAGPSASRSTGLPCSTCHPEPALGDLGGVHANGYVDVWFAYGVAGRDAKFDGPSHRCAGTCHDHGGTRPTPSWSDAPMTCNDCHLSPPKDHYRGACTNCHREADSVGTTLTKPILHANGKVDLGDGSGRCGACHGSGDDPWPSTGAHQAHAKPMSSRPVACETCHVIPSGSDRHPEGKGAATIRFAGLATQGGRRATYDAQTKTCAGNYCHEGRGANTPAPRWDAAPNADCGGCHGAPPPPPHSQASTCGGTTCHEGITAGLSITAAGRVFHVNGMIDRTP